MSYWNNWYCKDRAMTDEEVIEAKKRLNNNLDKLLEEEEKAMLELDDLIRKNKGDKNYHAY